MQAYLVSLNKSSHFMNNDALCFGETDLDNADKSSANYFDLISRYDWNRGSLLLRQSEIAFHLSALAG